MASYHSLRHFSFALLLVATSSIFPVLSQDPTPAPFMCDTKVNITREPGRCIWFGQCMEDDSVVWGSQLNCFNNSLAVPIDSLGKNFSDLLQDTCPEIWKKKKVCCDQNQLQALTSQTHLPRQLFSRCPACLKNFLDHFCMTTCDPDQSVYVDPTLCREKKDEKNDTIVAVASVDIYLTENYAERLYNSCSVVQDPQASSKVVDVMCGGVDQCSPHLWLGFLGDPLQNRESPFPMVYKYVSDNSSDVPPDWVDAKVYDFIPCNTTDTNYRCSCADCGTPDLCPLPPQPPKDKFPEMIVFFSVIGVGFFLTFILFFVAMVFGMWIFKTMNKGDLGSKFSRGGYGALDNNDSPTSSVGSINADDIPTVEDLATKPPRTTVCMPCYISGAHLENWIKKVFYHWGCLVARFWPVVIGVGVVLVGFIVLLTAVLHITNILPFTITTDPVQLWSAPNSQARLEKNYFDEHFEPFYRTEMIIFTPTDENIDNYTVFEPLNVFGVKDWTFGPVLSPTVLHEIYKIQTHLTEMVVSGTLDNGTEVNVTLSDICYKPLAPDNEHCATMSVLNYFQNNLTRLDHVEGLGDLINNSYHIHFCTRDPTSPTSSYFDEVNYPCLGDFGGPIDPNVVLGGFPNGKDGSPNYQNATATIVSFTVSNHLNDEENQKAKIWEKAFLDYMATPNLTNYTQISYSAERSIEDELARESKTDVFTILLSYILMFVYITLFLGHIRKPVTLLIDMKISVGFLGVLMVLFAVVGSICFLNLTRVTVTLIIIEVVPFLVLAVGVDNLFIIVHSYERQIRKFADARDGDLSGISPKDLIGRAIAEVAPSLLLTSISETTAFLLGAISTMPAVRTFSLYAGVAVFFNFLLQISVFLAALSIDARRQLANRFDLACCIKLKGMFDPRKGLDVMHTIMSGFASFILYPVVRPFVLLLFGVTSTLSLAMVFRLDVGLDQTLALPKDSYLENYFDDLFTYLHTGSPVYFVIKDGFNYSDPNFQKKFCSGAGCDKESIGSEIIGYSRSPDLTGIAEPAMLWVDTYFEWINPRSKCCGIAEDGSFCHYPGNDSCKACVTKEQLGENDWPKPQDFQRFLPWFLEDNPGTHCPSGGHAAFASGVKLSSNKRSVTTSYVMTYHTIMSNSSVYINGLRWARKLASMLSNYTGVEIFPYAPWYVYYEQYLSTTHDMALNIGVSIGAVFIVTFLLMGLNLWAALIVMLIVCMIIVHMLGCMALSGINANAVSLVNLVMTVGISVEFCSHIVRWFCSCNLPTRVERAHSSLSHMGASVVSGITLTKLIGVFVLFFAKSQIFEIYYFRMYMFMLLWGALHGLVFLPVLLSYLGPSFVPIKVIPPYSDPTSKSDPSTPPRGNKNANRAHDKRTSTVPSPVPQSRTPNINSTTDDVQYPSLPNVGNYRAPSPGRQPTTDFGEPQNYPQPTYPGQAQYQQRGEIYPQPNERSKLLNQ